MNADLEYELMRALMFAIVEDERKRPSVLLQELQDLFPPEEIAQPRGNA